MNASMLALLLLGQFPACGLLGCRDVTGFPAAVPIGVPVELGVPTRNTLRIDAKVTPTRSRYKVRYKGRICWVDGWLDDAGLVNCYLSEQRPGFWDEGTPEPVANRNTPEPAADPAVVPTRNAAPAPPAPEPVANRNAPAPIGEVVPNFGLEPGKMFQNRGPKLQASNDVARKFVEEAFREGQGGRVDQMPAKPPVVHVTLIGTEEEVQPVMADFEANPALRDLKAQVEVQEYRPDEWPVAGVYPTGGHPGVIVQRHGDEDAVVAKVTYRGSQPHPCENLR